MVRVARWTQRLLFITGFLILGYCVADWLNSRWRQAEGNQELDRIILNHKPDPAPAPLPTTPIPEGGLVGRVEIPKLELSAVIFQGTGNSVLAHGVGHLDGSALPGQAGNVVLAAHRDTFFRSLRNIHKGDLIAVTTRTGIRTYHVDSTEIVDPTETSVEDSTVKPTLTLITCYPFYFVGHAPKRFIVRALDSQLEASSEVVAKQKETARKAPSEERDSRRSTGEDTAKLIYVFKASQ